ncbi:uncharacterized protein N0V89_006448 [Didymosphaeria variabile]|uniref:FAD-binding domain-containing protein n=1 Tax=Didymosphaeria variabile TaxID=1932322 RepID=A0A9W8XHA8_9PLEO|nr:uncharacterized protein N0V89_006448 [Didymosphaeria variabile]KAJ4351109.1 hypothetical protein N0V89_006448 [Didymosphaeria variabile]
MSSPKNARVLIAGGSIAGLTLANILEQIGIDFLVLEKYKAIAPDVGASIGIFPNGFRILDQLGCHDTIKALVDGADSFEHMRMYDERGNKVQDIADASQHFKNRLAYEPIFVDRQMIIQILYDNLSDKSKVLTDKGVVHVQQQQPSGRVQVTTGDGSVYEGAILVGADGIHSTVRREMWRIADEVHPGHFPLSERTATPTGYRCIFGISKPNERFPKYSSQNVMGNGCSYLISTGPNHRIYWFLFKKLSTTVHGLYEKVPRYTETERDALAAEHADDPLNDTLRFGDLYESRTTATLQALPEVVFSKWHYGRIITIGDAAHKFNPIGGQGGNSAIEDSAVLANLIHEVNKSQGSVFSLTDANLACIFEKLHSLRHGRAASLMKASHDLQSLQAKETFLTRLVAKWLIPGSSADSVLEMLSTNMRPAPRLNMVPVPDRQHADLYNDERPAEPLSSAMPRFFTYGVFACLIGIAFLTMNWTAYPLSRITLEVAPKAYSTGVQSFRHTLNLVFLKLAGGTGWVDVGHTLQLLYLLLFLTPVMLIWYIEANRHESRGTLISR